MENKNKKAQAKTFAIAAIIALLALTLVWILVLNNNHTGSAISNDEPIKIGIIGHFSGEYAAYGIPMKNAVELAVGEINNNGGIDGRKLVLVVEDDGTDPVKAASAMNKLVNIDKVDYIVSAQGSGATSVVAPIANENNKILMITLGSAPGLASDNEYVFRSVPSDVYQAFEMVDYFNGNLKPKTVAGLYRNDPYGIGIKNIVEQGTSAMTVASELYDTSSSDFRAQLTKIKQVNPDVLVIAGAKDDYPTIIKQIREIGLSSTVVTSETFYDPEVLKKIGKNNSSGIYTFFQNDPKDYVDFKSRYTKKFGEEPSAFSMYAYDGMTSLAKSIEGSNNADEVRANLLKLSFNGASGVVGFNSEGDRTGAEYTVYKVINGEFVKI